MKLEDKLSKEQIERLRTEGALVLKDAFECDPANTEYIVKAFYGKFQEIVEQAGCVFSVTDGLLKKGVDAFKAIVPGIMLDCVTNSDTKFPEVVEVLLQNVLNETKLKYKNLEFNGDELDALLKVLPTSKNTAEFVNELYGTCRDLAANKGMTLKHPDTDLLQKWISLCESFISTYRNPTVQQEEVHQTNKYLGRLSVFLSMSLIKQMFDDTMFSAEELMGAEGAFCRGSAGASNDVPGMSDSNVSSIPCIEPEKDQLQHLGAPAF